MVGKKFTIIFSRRARNRLKEIADFYRREVSEKSAKRVKAGIIRAADTLANLPASKPVLPDTEHMPFQVRYAKYKEFKVVYRIELDTDTVRILTISHDAQAPVSVIDDI